MDLYEARRMAVRELIERPPFDGSNTRFADATGIARSYVTRMLKEPGDPNRKNIGEDTAIKIEEALHLPSGTLLSPTLSGHLVEEPRTPYRRTPDRQNSVISSDRRLQIAPIVPPPLYKLEDLMALGEGLPAAFRLMITDDAMAPIAGAGTLVDFTTTRPATFGDAVLVQDSTGAIHFRRMCQAPSGWEARPTRDAYATLKSGEHGLKVLAVFDGFTRKGSWAELES